ncbi:hypothetical protein [Microbacterium sp. AR7-10]|uniref:hypothetical protein n=1 Tax=Microbacterium sp. AR7-10 TaxID=1891970 RepID=UPI0008FC607A|nr:hypothetical protein [Microbacterium sp. AR7-10]OIU84780.1 hypothetical protein BFN01_13610 [Microbacterium sp. AR7-10]
MSTSIERRDGRMAVAGALLAGAGVVSAAIAAVLMFAVDDADAARGFAFVGMAGVVGAVIAAVRSTTTERKAVFAAGGVLLLIASSTMFGLSFS